MSDDAGSRLGRAFIIGMLMIGTLGFGLAGLCGAAFTAVGMTGMFSEGPENYSGAVLVFALPSLLIGGGLAWWCGYLLHKRWRDAP